MKRIITALVLLGGMSMGATAQVGLGMGMTPAKSKISIQSGDVSKLKGKTFKVEFTYDNISVGKFASEDEYIAKKKAEYNEKEPGRGDKWAAAWKADRANRFEPAFIAKWNELGEASGTKVSKDAGDDKLIIKTTSMEPGFNVGVAHEPANIYATLTFQDAGGKTLAVVQADKVPGQTFTGDFDTGLRLSESYEKLGKDVYKTISKKF